MLSLLIVWLYFRKEKLEKKGNKCGTNLRLIIRLKNLHSNYYLKVLSNNTTIIYTLNC